MPRQRVCVGLKETTHVALFWPVFPRAMWSPETNTCSQRVTRIKVRLNRDEKVLNASAKSRNVSRVGGD